MSFGFGAAGSQGSIRYAILLDSAAATKSLNDFKTSVTGVGTPTQAATRTMQQFQSSISAISAPTQTVTANMQKLVGTQGPLSAGLAKTSGAAKDMIANTNTLSTGSATLGTRIKDNASKFAGLATGLSATASGALQLASGFRDYNDATIAVERVQRKLSLATEAYQKAQDKLNALTAKGVKSGKEYEQAQLDVQQAQAAVSIQTQLLGESQERLFDSQTQFVTSIVPTVLGAIGSIGFAFKDLGGTGGISGLIAKFKGLGTGITGTVIPSFTGLGDKIKSVMTSFSGLGGLLSVGLAIGGAALIIDQIQKIQQAFDDAGFHFTKMKQGMLFSPAEVSQGWNEFQELIDATGWSVGQITNDMEGAKQKWVEVGGKLDKTGQIIYGTFWKAKEASKNLKTEIDKVPPSMNTAATSGNAMVNAMIVLRTQAESGKITWDQYFKSLAALKIPGDQMNAIIDEVNKRMTENKTAVTNAIKPVNDLGVGWNQLGDAWGHAITEVSKSEAILTGFGDTLGNLGKKFGALNAARKEFGNWLTPDMQLWSKWASDPNPSAILHSNAISILDVKSSMTGWDTIIKKSTVSSQDNARAIAEQTKKIEDLKARIKEGVGKFTVAMGIKTDDINKVLDDIIDNIDKKFKKPINTVLKMRSKVDIELQGFNAAIQTAATLDEAQADAIVKGIIKTIDEKFKGTKGPFAGLRAQLDAVMKDPNSVKLLNDALLKGDYTAAGAVITGDIQAGANKTPVNVPTELGKPAQPAWLSDPNLDKFLPNARNSLVKGSVAIPTTLSKPITTEFDAGVKTLTTNVANIANTVPAISVNTGPANKQLSTLIKRIDSIDNMKPAPKLNIGPANKTLSSLINRIDSIAKMKPAFQINQKPAQSAISQVINRIDSISNLHPSVTVKVNYDTSGKPAGIKAQGGFHGTLSEDTTILAHKGERVDIGHPTGGQTVAGYGSQTIILEMFDEKIVRKINARQGQNRFRFGA